MMTTVGSNYVGVRRIADGLGTRCDVDSRTGSCYTCPGPAPGAAAEFHAPIFVGVLTPACRGRVRGVGGGGLSGAARRDDGVGDEPGENADEQSVGNKVATLGASCDAEELRDDINNGARGKG
jgi:hypothetical protein